MLLRKAIPTRAFISRSIAKAAARSLSSVNDLFNPFELQPGCLQPGSSENALVIAATFTHFKVQNG